MKRWPRNWGVWGSIRSEWRCETELVLYFNRVNFKGDVKSETHTQLDPGSKTAWASPAALPRPRADDVTASSHREAVTASTSADGIQPAWFARCSAACVYRLKKNKKKHICRGAHHFPHTDRGNIDFLWALIAKKKSRRRGRTRFTANTDVSLK